ncbi:hypothetical protein [Flavobacterium sp. MDT1-60]|uniref:hypothetical protein n=1 Tax=Flavobacterium sp. MDT1-60 TaxID=1979344 RepID=UPI0017847BD1|nr:hypothetical protein [Flavobacterium sp. MDT1-60]QOG03872.1 hypothetical protein IHE43_06525 [Flavobacterium sp. MDT1-60]
MTKTTTTTITTTIDNNDDDTAIDAGITPPGIDITPKDKDAVHSIGTVTFKKTKSAEVLSPYVEAYYDSHSNALLIQAVVYVDSPLVENEILHYKIIQNTYIDIEGNPQLQFFIVYNMPEELSADLFIYEIVFNANDSFIGGFSNLEKIQTFLWDSDPETSRGTETPVRSI